MACPTGIRANDNLIELIKEAKNGRIRVMKVIVKNEQLCSSYEYAGTKDWKSDWRKTLPDCIDSFEPCFIIVRLDHPHDFVLISFSDDRAPVRDKMLLAATKATFKNEFGQTFLRYEYNVTNRNEITLENFEKWLAAKFDPAPLTDIERELESAAHERYALGAVSSISQTMRGVTFPIDRDAEDQLKLLAQGRLVYVQLAVDTLNEAIKLEAVSENIGADDLSTMIPRDKPRYHFFRFDHVFEDQRFISNIFIYSLPASGSTIKERMLYSSCKSPFIDAVKQLTGMQIDKKIEMDSSDKLTEESLVDYVHPRAYERPEKFAKPSGPRGARRVGAAGGR